MHAHELLALAHQKQQADRSHADLRRRLPRRARPPSRARRAAAAALLWAAQRLDDQPAAAPARRA